MNAILTLAILSSLYAGSAMASFTCDYAIIPEGAVVAPVQSVNFDQLKADEQGIKTQALAATADQENAVEVPYSLVSFASNAAGQQEQVFLVKFNADNTTTDVVIDASKTVVLLDAQTKTQIQVECTKN